jgi:hypothetical protein
MLGHHRGNDDMRERVADLADADSGDECAACQVHVHILGAGRP